MEKNRERGETLSDRSKAVDELVAEESEWGGRGRRGFDRCGREEQGLFKGSDKGGTLFYKFCLKWKKLKCFTELVVICLNELTDRFLYIRLVTLSSYLPITYKLIIDRYHYLVKVTDR